MTLPDCPQCFVPAGEGECTGCLNIAAQDVGAALAALDAAPVDAAWIEQRFGPDWRDGMALRGFVVVARKTLAVHSLHPVAVDRLLDACSDAEREAITRWRYAVALSGAIRGGLDDELLRLEALLVDDRVSLAGLAEWLVEHARAEPTQTTALMLPNPDNLPHWLARHERS